MYLWIHTICIFSCILLNRPVAHSTSGPGSRNSRNNTSWWGSSSSINSIKCIPTFFPALINDINGGHSVKICNKICNFCRKYSYLKIRLKIAITALNCSDDLASWGYQTASTMMSNRMLTMSMSKDKMTVRQESRMRRQRR